MSSVVRSADFARAAASLTSKNLRRRRRSAQSASSRSRDSRRRCRHSGVSPTDHCTHSSMSRRRFDSYTAGGWLPTATRFSGFTVIDCRGFVWMTNTDQRFVGSQDTSSTIAPFRSWSRSAISIDIPAIGNPRSADGATARRSSGSAPLEMGTFHTGQLTGRSAERVFVPLQKVLCKLYSVQKHRGEQWGSRETQTQAHARASKPTGPRPSVSAHTMAHTVRPAQLKGGQLGTTPQPGPQPLPRPLPPARR